MTQTNTLTSEEIVVAFGNSSRFPAGTEQFEVFAPFIGHLIEIVGEDHLNDTVGLANLCSTTAQFIYWLADNKELIGQLEEIKGSLHIPAIYRDMAGGFEAMAENLELILSELKLTEAQAIERDQVGLNGTAKGLYRAGELTFARLLILCPEVFVPGPEIFDAT